MPNPSRTKSRMLVVSLDGFPQTDFEELRTSRVFRRIEARMSNIPSSPMRSIIPAVSSVAWSTYLSGRNPGGHNIYGFIDRHPATGTLCLPNASSRKGPAIYRTLGSAEVSVIMMNIPMTYPPEPVNGIMIGGFLGVDVRKIAFPASISTELLNLGYIIDADTSRVREEPLEFIEQLIDIVRLRCRFFRQLLAGNPWRFAHLHIMETDRLFHFLWHSFSDTKAEMHPAIMRFLDVLDEEISQVLDGIHDADEVMIMSDHGFCGSEREWDINAWLAEKGWLIWSEESNKGLKRIAPQSKAFSLPPGRIYLKHTPPDHNRHEMNGHLGIDSSCMDIIKELKTTGAQCGDHPIFSDVLPGADVFYGEYSCFAPDIIAIPFDGIELKSRMEPGPVESPSRMEGTHTLDNAIIWLRHGRVVSCRPGIIDLFPTILSYFGLFESGMEGRILAAWP
ncbi:alkaline phosphatase family protein [bacterium]|nr:alkaline phosphatase family protein [candidate division CSSED10-310 bacterium]